MRRIRAVFVGLAVVLLVPVVLLVDRALDSVAIQDRVSHQAVAERLFDEMERQLSQFLRAEEERPFSDYDLATEAGRDAVAPYVAGYFQIDPDGRFRGPAVGAGKKVGSAEAELMQGETLEGRVRRGLARPAEPVGERRGPVPPEAASEIDHLFADDTDAAVELDERVVADAGDTAEVSPYSALQSLNRAARDREERQVKRASPQAAAPSSMLAAQSMPRKAEVAEELGDRPFEAPTAGRAGVRAAPPPPVLAAREAVREPSSLRQKRRADDRLADAAAEPAGAAPAPAEPVLEVHPMVGRLIDANQLLLYRNVLLGDQRFRQGLVVRLADLFEQLDAVVAGSAKLAPFVERQFYTATSPVEPYWRPTPYEYTHRFAEPFDDLYVRLALRRLPGVASAGYLYAIAALLLLSAPVGLLALYRMVAVTVRFAERRNNFVAAVSHELKTPLTAIRMHAEMLRDDMVPDEAKRQEYYGTITAESERLSRLIDNVLEFSRLEQGTRQANLTVGALGPVVAEAADLLQPHVREGGFDLDVEIEDGLPPVRYDRDAVLQVVFNLVDNALKYAADAGDRRIRIRCGRQGEGVVVAVSDRGRGVPPRHLGQIFEPFFRGGSELTRTAKGTGIGLALVRGLAETMDAAVTGRNLRDGGFEVSLRFRAAPTG